MSKAKVLLFLTISCLANNFSYSMDIRRSPTEVRIHCSELYEAIFDGNCTRASRALVDGADVNASYAKGMTPLLWAIRLDNIKIIKCLRAHGVDINRADDDGRTPLLCAILWGHIAIAEYLLDCGADSTLCDCWERTAWSVAIDQGDAAIFERLLCGNNQYAYAMILMTRTTTQRA